MFSLAGPRAADLLEGLGAQGLLTGAQHAHAVFACAGAPVLAASGSGLGPAFPGATLVADETVAAELWARLRDEVGCYGVLRNPYSPSGTLVKCIGLHAPLPHAAQLVASQNGPTE